MIKQMLIMIGLITVIGMANTMIAPTVYQMLQADMMTEQQYFIILNCIIIIPIGLVILWGFWSLRVKHCPYCKEIIN